VPEDAGLNPDDNG